MSLLSYLILVTVYVLVVSYMVRCYGKGKALRPRDILYILLWPLDLVWPFLIAGVALLELCAVLAAKRVRFGPRQPTAKIA